MTGVEDAAGSHILEYQLDGQLTSETITTDPDTGAALLSGFSLTNAYGTAGFGLRDSLTVSKAGATTVSNGYQYQDGRLWKASQGSVASGYAYHSQSGFPQSVTLSQSGSAKMTNWTHRDFDGRITGQLARQGVLETGNILTSAGYRYDSKGRRQWLTREDGTRWEYGYNSRDEVESGKKRLSNNGSYLAGQQFVYNYDAIGNRTTAQYGGDENGANLRTITYTLEVDHDSTVDENVNKYGKIEYSGHTSLIGFGGPSTQITPSDPSLLTEIDQANQSNRWWREMELQTPAQSNGLFANLSFEENGVPLADPTGQLWMYPTNYEPDYDEDGNLTSDARWDYSWNGENRLVSMTTKTSAQTAGHPWMRLTFAYDWQGRRVQKKVEEKDELGNVIATKELRYFYDGWNLIAEYQFIESGSQFTLQNSYLWGLDASGSQQGAGGVGGLLAAIKHSAGGEAAYFPSYDGNGNIIAWTDESGAVTQRNDYDPFGNLISKQGEVEGLSYGFSTKYTDEETGLCYYGYRYYDPVTGRWPSRDPIEERGGVNLYGFVNNEGFNAIDFLGLDFIAVGQTPPGTLAGIGINGIKHLSVELWSSKCKMGVNVKYRVSQFERLLHVGRRGQRELLVTSADWYYKKIPSGSASSVAINTLVGISFIEKNRGTQEDFVIAYEPLDSKGKVDDAKVQKKWNEIKALDGHYSYAMNFRFDDAALKWPNNRYQTYGNNSNTFVKWLLRKVSIPMPRRVGFSPGRSYPKVLKDPYRYVSGPYRVGAP